MNAQAKSLAARGLFSGLSVARKKLVPPHKTPLLFASLMESNDYDGTRDCVSQKMIVGKCQSNASANDGTIGFGEGDRIGFSIKCHLTEKKNLIHAALEISFDASGEFKDRFIREVGLRIPLALDFRKRIVQAGDQGIRFDTRHFYQFHTYGDTLLGAPDTNRWGHFHVEQETPRNYRLWRAESAETAAVHAFAGRKAAGWMTVYDQTGGVLFAYRDISRRAPKDLCVNAASGGEATIYFYPPTQPALDLNDKDRAKALLGKPHKIDFIFFKGIESEVQPDRELARIWGVKKLPSDGPTKFRPLLDELNFNDAPAAKGMLSPMVVGGIPVPRGSVIAPNEIRLFMGRKDVPCQADPIAFWPDNSIKWLLLTFPLDGNPRDLTLGKGDGDEVSFDVTLRKGPPARFRMVYGKRVRSGEITEPLLATGNVDSATINTGPLSVALTKGEQWLESVLLRGKEMLRDDGKPQAIVDFARKALNESYPVGTTHPDMELEPGPVRIEKIDIELAGPLRAVVRLEGHALCKEPPRIIMRLEFYRGKPSIRITHTVEFMHKDPREVFVRRLALRIPLEIDSSQARVMAGGQNAPVAIPQADVAGLRQTSYLNCEIWRKDAQARHPTIVAAGNASRGWMDIRDEQAGMAILQRDMWKEAPKELIFNSKESAVEIGLWPESSPLMDTRRYSIYPHRSQGESVSNDDMRWVLDYYYHHDPFVGVSRSHETLLVFHDAAVKTEEIDSVASDFNSRPLIYAGWPWYKKTEVTIPLADPDVSHFRHFNKSHADVFNWWLYHQKCYGWYGFWDFGDIRHKFRSGYGYILPPADLAEALQLPPEDIDNLKSKGFEVITDYACPNDWPYDNGRWGWSNTEGLINLSTAYEYLRTGRRDLFFFMEAYARHARDVDVRHGGLWFGKGTRHGVQHWSDGNHEERQTTFTEYRYHYLLTGEPRTREWSQELTDGWYMRTASITSATHGGRSYGLLFNWEITGDPRVGKVLEMFVHTFAQPAGIAGASVVMFPQVAMIGEPRALNTDDFFFHSFGAMHALLDYYYLTKDRRLRDSILKMAATGSPADERRKAVAFAARHSPDKEKYKRIISQYAANDGAGLAFQQVPGNPDHWSGDGAFIVGNVSGGMFWLSSALYVMGALDREPEIPMKKKECMKAREEGPRKPEPRALRESWQSEYNDISSIKRFLSDKING